jgi:hypothetical protein
MNRRDLKKLIKTQDPEKFKSILLKHNLDILYYSDSLIDYLKEYLEIIEEDYKDINFVREILEPKLNYDIKKYKEKLKEYENTITKKDLNYNYNINTVEQDLNKLDQYNKILSYKSGYEYGKYLCHEWLLNILKRGKKHGRI